MGGVRLLSFMGRGKKLVGRWGRAFMGEFGHFLTDWGSPPHAPLASTMENPDILRKRFKSEFNFPSRVLKGVFYDDRGILFYISIIRNPVTYL